MGEKAGRLCCVVLPVQASRPNFNYAVPDVTRIVYALYVLLQREQASIEGSNLAAIQLKLTQSQQELEKLKSNSSTAEAALNKSNGMTWYYKFAIIMCASPFPQYGWLVTLLSQARLLRNCCSHTIKI